MGPDAPGFPSGPSLAQSELLRERVTAAGGRDIRDDAFPAGTSAFPSLTCRLAAVAIPTLAESLATVGLEVQLLAATDTRTSSGDFTLTYVFAPPTGRPRVTALVSVPANSGTSAFPSETSAFPSGTSSFPSGTSAFLSGAQFPSLATRSFAASRFEREIHDLMGLVPVGHPDLRRLALHQFWPEGYHPLRRDAVLRDDFVDEGQPFPFRHVDGEGIYEITVGPVHAGIIEPGHFRFSVEGETIVNLETRLGFVHKGTEKLFETLPFERTPALAECVSGDETVAHAVAYCQALEALGRTTIPRRAAGLRVILMELERLYNHTGDIGMIVNDTGFAFGHAHCLRLRERLLRVNEELTGHRLMRGAIVPGGILGAIEGADVRSAAALVTQIVAELMEIGQICLDNTLVLERLQGTGTLTMRTAREMQVVGLVGRASGIDADARRDTPSGAYVEIDVAVPSYTTGDVWARTMVRLDEARESARLIGVVAEHLIDGACRAPLAPFRDGDHTVSVVEAWRGPVWYWVLASGQASVGRVKIVDPSYRNWPALEYAVLKNIVPDFPLCNKSFNLSYSGNDL